MPNVLNSFGDATDESIAAETARIIQARQRAAQAQAHTDEVEGPAEPAPVPVRQGRVPPHVGAARVADPLASAEQVESVGNVPTYRLPSSNITDRGRRPNNAPPPPTSVRGAGQRVNPSAVNNMPPGTPNNPNFRGGGNR